MPDDLMLKRADWGDGPVSEESYFVHHEGRVVGRIMLHQQGTGFPGWNWVIAQAEAGDRWDPDNYCGAEVTREAAMTAFAKAWRGQ